MGESEVVKEISLKEQGNEFFKAGNYLKAAALYTQAIKKDPSNATLYRFCCLHSLYLFYFALYVCFDLVCVFMLDPTQFLFCTNIGGS